MTHYSHKRKKRRLFILFTALAVVLLIGAVVFFASRPNDNFALNDLEPSPIHTPAITAAVSAPAATPLIAEDTDRERSYYEIAASLSPDASTLSCIERLSYLNTSSDTLYEIVMNIYANAYLTDQVVGEQEFKSVYGRRFSIGGLDIKRVSLNGVPTYYEYKNREKTQLSIPLVLELEPGDSAELLIEFGITIPKAKYRFGTGEHATMLGNVFPIAAVYENGWRSDNYYPIGDPFYSDVADYALAVRLPKEYIPASTGTIVSTLETNDTVTYFISAPGVRDAALAFASKYLCVTQNSGKTKVLSFAENESKALFAAKAASEALMVFSDLIGPYPYESLSVAQSDINGGMEYPGLIMIGDVCYGKYNQEFGEFCIAHETAHQWWYAAVGSDQINSPWLDEALTEYMGFVYWREKYGNEEFERLWNTTIGPFADSAMHPIDTPLSEFASMSDYAASVYYKGAEMFRALNEKLGDKVFFDALRQYYRQHCFKNAEEQDLVNAFSKSAGEDLGEFFNEWGIRLN